MKYSSAHSFSADDVNVPSQNCQRFCCDLNWLDVSVRSFQCQIATKCSSWSKDKGLRYDRQQLYFIPLLLLVRPRECGVRKDNGSRKRKTTRAGIRNNRDCSLAPCLPTLLYPGITWGSLKTPDAWLPHIVILLVAGMVRMRPGVGCFLTCGTVWEPLPCAGRTLPSQRHLRDLSEPTCIDSEAASAGRLGSFGSYVQITENEVQC